MDSATELDRAAADIPLTGDARTILEHATRLAAERGPGLITAADVLEATLREPKSLAFREIVALGLDPSSIHLHGGANGVGGGAVSLRQLLVNANREAQVLGHYRVDSIHLLLAMLYSDSPSTAGPLQEAGLTIYDLRSHLQSGMKPAVPSYRDATAPDHSLRRRPWPSLRGVLSISPVFAGIVGVTGAAGALLWTGLLPGLTGLLMLLFVIAGWITSLCIHEFGHALVAYLGGDRAVAASGYLTLNPLRYTNIVFSIVMPVLFLVLGGIGLPGGAVYINHSALRTKAWSSMVSLAGPAGTLLCALAAASPFMLRPDLAWAIGHAGFAGALAFLGFIEVFALVLNLIPVPGLDGFGAVRPWLPFTWQMTASRLGMNGIFLVFLVLWVVAPARNAFYEVVFQLTSALQINPLLIGLGQSHMRLF